jgi:hypothetical protein
MRQEGRAVATICNVMSHVEPTARGIVGRKCVRMHG